MKAMALPTVHINGTSRETLLESHCEAARAVALALEALAGAAPNPRDYYPQGDDAFAKARSEHAGRMERLRSVLDELREISEAISNA